MTFDDLVSALQRNNAVAGAGYIEHGGTSYPVRIGGLLKNADEVLAVVVGWRNGVAVRIGDVATVRIGSELRTGSASKNGHEVVIGTTLMLIGSQ